MNIKELREKLITKFKKYHVRDETGICSFRIDFNHFNINDYWSVSLMYPPKMGECVLILSSIDLSDENIGIVEKFVVNFMEKNSMDFYMDLNKYVPGNFRFRIYIENVPQEKVIKMVENFISGAKRVNNLLKGRTVTGRKDI